MPEEAGNCAERDNQSQEGEGSEEAGEELSELEHSFSFRSSNKVALLCYGPTTWNRDGGRQFHLRRYHPIWPFRSRLLWYRRAGRLHPLHSSVAAHGR